jgi:hypothetical protein
MRNFLIGLQGAALAALSTFLPGILTLFLAAGVYVVWAQPVTQNQVSGNECWNAGQGPGGPGQFLCINLVRNGNGILVVSGSGAATTQATTSVATYFWSGTAPTTWTVTMPNTPFDGEVVRLSSDTTLTTMVTVQAGTTGTMNTTYNAQTVTANTTVAWQYSQVATKWYRSQ